ncbi:MAG: 4-hydroxyphenylacetate 3-monooxygenase, oxygenase component [Conexivisphaerales archaeon]
MAIRNGERFLRETNSLKREIWYGDTKIILNAAEHPAFKGIAKTMAELYDLQSKEEMLNIMTYESPLTGERVGTSFLQPKTQEDLRKRRMMMQTWADFHFGFLGRTPDYLNSSLMAMASAADYFGRDDESGIDFASNIRAYYEYVREHDLLLTHTLINPQVNRSVGPSKQSDPFIAARILEKRSDGLVVRGARMLATFPLADEIMVFPSTVIRSGQDDAPYAMAFALPLDTPGLKLICRQSFSSQSAADNPLSAWFDEQDAVVIFDDVFVPKERIFILEDPERSNRVSEATDAIVFMAHQSLIREIAKAEFLTGLAVTIAETIGADQFQHVQEKIAELMMMTEALKAFLDASEAKAKVNQWGILTPDYAPLNAARNLWPRISPTFVTVIKQLGASGLMAIPPDSVLKSEMKEQVDKYYQAKLANAEERIRLFKLAWDAIGSSFGSRQELYERFFFGDPVRMASALYSWYDKEPLRNKVRRAMSLALKGK